MLDHPASFRKRPYEGSLNVAPLSFGQAVQAEELSKRLPCSGRSLLAEISKGRTLAVAQPGRLFAVSIYEGLEGGGVGVSSSWRKTPISLAWPQTGAIEVSTIEISAMEISVIEIKSDMSAIEQAAAAAMAEKRKES